MKEQIKVSDLDFQTIKKNLIDHFVNKDTQFSDWDFEGSNLNTMLDVLAYNTHYNGVLAHMAVNESFIDSAQLRTSVVSLAKLLGYTPRSYSAAKALLSGEFTASPSGPNKFIFEKGTRFVTSSASAGSFEFVVLDDLIQMEKDPIKGVYKNNPDTPICIYEGRLINRTFIGHGLHDEYNYVIPDKNIDISTLKVKVYPTAAKQTGSGVVFHRYNEDDINSNDTSAIYFIFENHFGQYEITFGNGIYGRKIESENVIEVEYLITSGSDPNGIRSSFRLQSFVPLDATGASQYINQTSSLLLLDRVGGGAEKETLERVRENATRTFIAQNRVVTAEDYRYMIRAQFPFIQSVSIWGGEDNDPPIYGKVFISPRAYDNERAGGSLSLGDKESIKNYLQNKRILSIQPEIIDPQYINIVLDVLFKYDPSLLTIGRSELIELIRKDFLKNYNEEVLRGFTSIFRHSAFQQELDNYNSAILNSLVRVFLINYEPAVFKPEFVKHETIIEYGAPLTVDDNKAIVEVQTNIDWTEGGVRVYLADEPGTVPNLRNLYTYHLNKDNTRKRLRDVGTLDLNAGKITFNSSVITDPGEDLELKIICIPKSNDIVGKRNLLINIDEQRSDIISSIDEIAASGSSRSARYATFNRDR